MRRENKKVMGRAAKSPTAIIIVCYKARDFESGRDRPHPGRGLKFDRSKEGETVES